MIQNNFNQKRPIHLTTCLLGYRKILASNSTLGIKTKLKLDGALEQIRTSAVRTTEHKVFNDDIHNDGEIITQHYGYLFCYPLTAMSIFFITNIFT